MQVPGTLIEGKYEIIAKIREGGMGTIYKVRHRLLDEIRVVKVMRPQTVANEELKRRFVEEAKTATRLKHPNICTIHDFALDDDGTAYLVMEFIDGVTLTELERSSQPPGLAMTLEIAHQALLALSYLHRRNVVHRDIAPDNLMLTYDEDGLPVVKLIDLGIAKALDKTGMDMTSTGVFLGKLKYASPEQYGALPAGEKIDGRSDLYCLGVVLYEMLTATRPFVGETPAELLRAHLFQEPLPFSQTDPEGRVPAEVQAVILKALQKQREDRYATAEEFDREILRLRSRFADAGDPEATLVLLRKVRESADDEGTITPSAQDRLDRQFGAHTTPSPSRPSLSPVMDQDAEATAALPPAAAVPTSSRRALPILGLVALAGIAVAVAVLVRSRTSQAPAVLPTARPAGVERGSAPTAAPLVLPTAGVAEAPKEEPAQAQSAPPPEPTSAPAAQPAKSDVAERRAAEDARARATTARRAAERVAAERVAPALFDAARSRQREGDRLLGQKDYPGARSAFQSGASAFREAENWVRNRPASPPTPLPAAPPTAEVRIAERPERPIRAEPTARPEPTRVVVVPPTEPPLPAAVPPAGKSGAADQDRVRDVLREYERAHNTLDVGLYARVFPSFVTQHRQELDRAWQNLKSQHLELEIRQIDVRGQQAVVRGYQRLVATPQAGTEQRDGREVVLRLEKRGDGWVITGRS